jgi:hypothetical protein
MSDDPRRWVVYQALNARNEKTYIGWTCDLKRRKGRHSLGARNGMRTPFASAIRKYGMPAFRFDVLAIIATEKAVKIAERAEIAARSTQDPQRGYNVADGGDEIGSDGAKAVHARPEYRKALMANMPARHAKAQARTRCLMPRRWFRREQ